MPYALLSVYDKIGLIPFAHGLVQLGWTLLASGQTAHLLKEAQLPVTLISDYTQTPEMLGGRVKTLHPAIYAGLLAQATDQDQQTLKDFGWNSIDLVAVSLYPFQETIANPNSTLEDAINQIDIGGITLIRAAAKNHARVMIATSSEDYSKILDQLSRKETNIAYRKQLASKAFALSSAYDTAIAQYLAESNESATPTEDEAPLSLTLYPSQSLRYGENPHQAAQLYGFKPKQSPLGGELLQGKALSYNNILDLDTAWRSVLDFDAPTVCIVKHASPCGIASEKRLADACQAALASDPVSAFGGIIASNRTFDEDCVTLFDKRFIECIAAPDFSKAALTQLTKRPACRLLKMTQHREEAKYELRSVYRGILKQSFDSSKDSPNTWQIKTQRRPTPQEMQSLQFAWKACRQVKSNAILLVQGTATVGIGGGQPNRLDCIHLAAKRAGARASGAVLASDAFLPFPDVVEIAAQYGIQAIIQPGGSIKDSSVIEAADRLNISLVFTGMRHFRH